MTFLGVVKNTKIGCIALPTTSLRVVLFAVVSPIGKIAKAIGTLVGMVSSYENQISSLLPKAIRYYESYCYK
jgi:hypothetical protein